MPVRFRKDPPASIITPESLYRRRRDVLKLLGFGAVGLATGCRSQASAPASAAAKTETIPGAALTIARTLNEAGGETQTRYKDATHYNNYYEFGTGKGRPVLPIPAIFSPGPGASRSPGTPRRPVVSISKTFSSAHPLQERIYRMRCVEAWSMVIPWVGFR